MQINFKAVGVALIMAAVAVPSFAGEGKDKDKDKNRQFSPEQLREVHSTPEINGAGASLALALLGGMVLIARERRRQQ